MITPVIEPQLKRRLNKQKSDITFKSNFNPDGFPLVINNCPGLGSSRKILWKIHTQLKNMRSHHCKIYCLRMDFHVNLENWQQTDISELMKKANSKIKTKYKTKRVGYVWAREASQSGSHHYHTLLILDGSKVNRSESIFNLFASEWDRLGHPRPSLSKPHMIKSMIDNSFEEAFYHFSYLAKVYSKYLQPAGARNFGGSNIKPSNRILEKTYA